MNIVWIVFPEIKTGSLLRDNMRRRGIKHQNENAVPILQVVNSFQLKGSGTKVTRKMFPLVVCFCMTSYKSQGQTLSAVIMNYQNSITKHGQFYVSMTRI